MPADAGERLGGRRARRAERVGVDLVALADAGRDEARCLELAVEVEDDRLATLAAQLAALAEPREPAAELLVDDLRAVAAQRLRNRQRKCVRARLSRERDLDLRHRSAMVRCGRLRRCIDSREVPDKER